jgi:photosystem II biogenesis protein Psp29
MMRKPAQSTSYLIFSVSTVRTVSETKRTFYSLHTRPINALFRRVVEELMVEMHLLSVNVDFSYDPIFALGVVTAYDRFMQGYRPEADKEMIFSALCKAMVSEAHQYRSDAQRLLDSVRGMSLDALMGWFNQSSIPAGLDDLQSHLQRVITNPKFKYSRLFAIGLYTLLETVNPDLKKDAEKLQSLLSTTANAFHIPLDQVQKDLEIYRSNLDKMEQARAVMEDILQAERKRREQQSQADVKTESVSDHSADPSASEATNTNP